MKMPFIRLEQNGLILYINNPNFIYTISSYQCVRDWNATQSNAVLNVHIFDPLIRSQVSLIFFYYQNSTKCSVLCFLSVYLFSLFVYICYHPSPAHLQICGLLGSFLRPTLYYHIPLSLYMHFMHVNMHLLFLSSNNKIISLTSVQMTILNSPAASQINRHRYFNVG